MKISYLKYFLLSIIFLLCFEQSTSPDYSIRTSYYKNVINDEINYSEIICATFNIQLGFRANLDPWTKDDIGCSEDYLKDLTNHLLKVNPNIICLQEVPINRYNTEIKNILERPATNLNMNFAFGAHGFNDPYGITPVNGEWGNAILTKFPILNITNYENEYLDVWTRRSILSAEIKVGNENMVVSSLHFIPSDYSISNSIQYFSKHSNKKSIIMGDFNLIDLPEYEEIGFYDVFKSDSLIFGIDKILINPPKYIVQLKGIIPGNQELSDHYANYCIMKIR